MTIERLRLLRTMHGWTISEFRDLWDFVGLVGMTFV